jgi:excisionase family DNA binding protein
MTNDLASDLLFGAAPIAQYLGITRSKTYHLIEDGQLPVGRQGKRIVASKAKLRAHYDRLLGDPSQVVATAFIQVTP